MQEAACRLSMPDEVAGKIGAVNTLIRQPDGSLAGHNTDWDAAISAVENAMRARCACSPLCTSCLRLKQGGSMHFRVLLRAWM